MDIHRSSIKDFIMPKVKSVVVTDYYEGIRNMLKSRPEFPYKDLLANPRLRTQMEITWSSDVFSKKPVVLAELQEEQKGRYAYLLKDCIRSVENLAGVLKVEGNLSLCELLTKAI